MPATSFASACVTAGSIPYSRSPMSASPESLSRTRRKAGTLGRGRSRSRAVPSSREREALELEHFGSRFGEHLANRLRAVVDPRLIGEHPAPLRKEALVEHSGDDLLTCLLGFRLHLLGVEVDLALRGDEVVGDVLAADPARIRPGAVHGEVPRQHF